MLTNKGKTANTAIIEGILSEVDLVEAPYTSKTTGESINAIRGTIKVKTTQYLSKTDTEPTTLEVPIRIFFNELTKEKKVDSRFESAKRLMTDFTSIASSDEEHADRIRVTGTVVMNEYYNRNGALVSFPAINGSFFTKVTGEYNPKATFTMTAVVANKGYETDKDGVETDRYRATVILPQWNGEVDVLPIYPANKNVANGMETSDKFQEGDTVVIYGNLNFSARTEKVLHEVDFGEPSEEVRTIAVSELLMTGISYLGDLFDNDEVTEALKRRKARLAEQKENTLKRPKKATPPPTAGKGFKDLGF